MRILESKRSRKIFFVVNLIVQIVSSVFSFVFALFVLAQFGQVERVRRLELGLLISASVELVRFVAVSLVRQHKIDFHVLRNKSAEEKTNFLVKATVYCLKLSAAIVIVFLAQFGGLDEIEGEIALSTEPTAIAYMVFVFFALFLNMFSVYIAVAFSDYSVPILGRKVRFITEKPLGTEEDGKVFPLNFGHLGGMSDYCDRADAFLLGVDKATDDCEGKIAALLVGQDGEEIWLVAPEGKLFPQKQIKEQLHGVIGNYRLKTRRGAIEFYCFVNGNA